MSVSYTHLDVYKRQALEMGHLLEPLVAKIFQHRTGYKVYQIKKDVYKRQLLP